MAGRTNIVSFEVAKAYSRRGGAVRSGNDTRASRGNGSNARAASRSSALSQKDEVTWFSNMFDADEDEAWEEEARNRSNRKSTTQSGRSKKGSSRETDMRSSDRRKAVEFAESDERPSNAFSGNRGTNKGRNRTASQRDNRGGSDERNGNQRFARSQRVEANRGDADGRQTQRKNTTSRESSRNERRREKTKARADRMFAQQFADSEFQESVEDAPRAAVYEGQMGAKHRKSARMQRSSAADSPSAKLNMAGWLSALPFTPRTLKVATAMICVVLFCGLLYGPAQQYYQAQREHEKLVVEYNAISDRNTALDEKNDILASDAGMEDAVRQKYGYVKTGEQVAYVAGLSEEAAAARRDSDELRVNVMSSTVKAPEEWYTPLLDTFFGVE